MGLFWIIGAEHNSPPRKVYKQIVSCACFHFLTVMIGLDLTRRNHLHIALVARFQSLQTETRRVRWSFKALYCYEELTCCQAPEVSVPS